MREAHGEIREIEGRKQYDDDGNEIVRLTTCGECGQTWNDAIISGRTPAPAGRCPFEHEHRPAATPNAQHTPTPWVYNPESGDILAEPWGEGNGRHEVALDVRNPADADLIARAVNAHGPLVEALERAVFLARRIEEGDSGALKNLSHAADDWTAALRLARQDDPCHGEARGDGYPGTRYFHDDPRCPGHD